MQNQNKLLQEQILYLANFLNLTMVQDGKHQEALYEMATRLLILSKLLMSTTQAVCYLSYTVAALTDTLTGVTHLTLGILSLKENVRYLV